MTNIVGVDPAQVAVGQPVQVRWEPVDDGRSVVTFEPATT